MAIILLKLSGHGQQKINTFQITDYQSKKPIPYVQVSIPRAGLHIATYKDGLFAIPGNLTSMSDTMFLNAQNYAPLKLPLNSLSAMPEIALKRLPATTQTALLKKYNRRVVLNNYNPDQVGHYAGMPAENAPFNYLQLAQLFQTDASHNHIVNISINKTRGMHLTRFRIRIYSVDAITGGPGTDVCDKIIDVDNFDEIEETTMRRVNTKTVIEKRVIEIDLKKAGIVIPLKSFYIAIEWLRNNYNQSMGRFYNSATNKFETINVYRPFIGISPVKGEKLNIWALNFDRKWIPYNHFSPFGTDLAIQLTVEN
ncbi:MAG: hypothetical protein V4619_08605 [Bacteroidota bacterium]